MSSNGFECIRFGVEEGVARITLHRPEAMNAMNLDLMRELKRLLLTSELHGLETQMELEARAIAAASGSSDGREGVAAFVAKRRPEFQGR